MGRDLIERDRRERQAKTNRGDVLRAERDLLREAPELREAVGA